MKDIANIVISEAAKSNIEKRQVGCVIVGYNPYENEEKIVVKGHNIEGQHAEAMACENFVAEAVERDQFQEFKVYVSHPPCHECAKLLADHGFTNIKVIEAHIKFDGDKLRYDLIDGEFIKRIYTNFESCKQADLQEIRKSLWDYSIDPSQPKNVVNNLIAALHFTFDHYACFMDFEEALARVLTFGARKYKANNWKKCEDTGRYLAAAHRHLRAKIAGEDYDPETGFDHLDHVITNLMFLYVLGYSNDD